MSKCATGAKTVDEYLQAVPEGTREVLQQLRQAIREEAPEAEESISYGMPTFKLNGPLVYFSAFANHIGFYPTGAALEEQVPEAAKYRTGKGTLQFKLAEPLPLLMIRQIVRVRIQQNLAKK